MSHDGGIVASASPHMHNVVTLVYGGAGDPLGMDGWLTVVDVLFPHDYHDRVDVDIQGVGAGCWNETADPSGDDPWPRAKKVLARHGSKSRLDTRVINLNYCQDLLRIRTSDDGEFDCAIHSTSSMPMITSTSGS